MILHHYQRYSERERESNFLTKCTLSLSRLPSCRQFGVVSFVHTHTLLSARKGRKEGTLMTHLLLPSSIITCRLSLNKKVVLHSIYLSLVKGFFWLMREQSLIASIYVQYTHVTLRHTNITPPHTDDTYRSSFTFENGKMEN